MLRISNACDTSLDVPYIRYVIYVCLFIISVTFYFGFEGGISSSDYTNSLLLLTFDFFG